MKKTVFVIMILLLATFAYADTTGRLAGTVRIRGGDPINGATVKITSKENSKISFTVKTDKKGSYSQIGLGIGTYVIEVSADGYMPDSAEWKVKLGEATVLDFGLTPIPKAAVVKEGPGAADFKQASQAFEGGKYEDALAAITRAVSADASNPVYVAKLGVINQKLGKDAEAEAAFKKLVELDPSSFPGWFNLGHARFGMKNYTGAAEAFEHATKLNSNDAEAFFNLGSAHFNEGKIPEAVAAFEKAIQIKPDHVQAQYWLGNGYVNLNKIPEAKAAFQKFLQLAPATDPMVPQVKQLLDALSKM